MSHFANSFVGLLEGIPFPHGPMGRALTASSGSESSPKMISPSLGFPQWATDVTVSNQNLCMDTLVI